MWKVLTCWRSQVSTKIAKINKRKKTSKHKFEEKICILQPVTASPAPLGRIEDQPKKVLLCFNSKYDNLIKQEHLEVIHSSKTKPTGDKWSHRE